MEEWERVFNINVKGTLLCYKAAAKVMIEQNRGGRIIGMYWFSPKTSLLKFPGASSLAGKKGRRRHSVCVVISYHYITLQLHLYAVHMDAPNSLSGV